MKPVRLRPHHFLCILTYVGKGYTKRFVRGFDQVMRDIKRGAPVALVRGPDDICIGLRGRQFQRHCFSDDVKRRDRGALADFRKRAMPLSRAAPLTPLRVRRLREAYASNEIRTGCAACGWKKLCDRNVAATFAGCRLFPPARTHA
jgi:hypothetical protein